MNFIDKDKIGLHRKPIHILLLENTHKDLKSFCKENRVTMQEIVENFITGFLDGRKEFVEIVSKMVHGKKTKRIKRITQAEAESIYDAIERLSFEDQELE